MGNKLGKKHQIVDEKYTRPQGLYHNRVDSIDHKKLKKLILDSKLAPCYPGDEECTVDSEECPICFLHYPSLNRSRCCMKGICTECFLQMKPTHSTRPTQCPFCKTSNYVVEYRGVRTKEEMGMEQVEEQRVIEAKIRMRQREVRDEEERMQKRINISFSNSPLTFGEVEYQDAASSSLSDPSFGLSDQHGGVVSSQESRAVPAIRQYSHTRHNRRDEEFDLDLEDVMVMEAIWLSIQECGTQRNHACESTPSEPSILEDRSVPQAAALLEGSPSGGLACAIAALAERQHMNGDMTNDAGSNMQEFSTSLGSNVVAAGEAREGENYRPEHWADVSLGSGQTISRDEGEWGTDHGSEVAEVGTSYASSNARSISDATVEAAEVLENSAEHFSATRSGSIVPESFEEQMMLAMAVSLAEAQRGRCSPAWP